MLQQGWPASSEQNVFAIDRLAEKKSRLNRIFERLYHMHLNEGKIFPLKQHHMVDIMQLYTECPAEHV